MFSFIQRYKGFEYFLDGKVYWLSQFNQSQDQSFHFLVDLATTWKWESRPDLRDVSSQPRKEDCDSMSPRDCLLDKLNGCYCLHVRTHRWSTPWWGPSRRRRRRARRQWRSCRCRMSLPWEHGLRTPRSTTLQSKVQSENLRQPVKRELKNEHPPPSLSTAWEIS